DARLPSGMRIDDDVIAGSAMNLIVSAACNDPVVARAGIDAVVTHLAAHLVFAINARPRIEACFPIVIDHVRARVARDMAIAESGFHASDPVLIVRGIVDRGRRADDFGIEAMKYGSGTQPGSTIGAT